MPIFVLDEFPPNQSSTSCSSEIGFGFPRVCFQNCSWSTRLFAVFVRSSVSLFFVLFSFSITCGSYSFTLCMAFESLIGSDFYP